jgi:peptidyl-prolyl cis-trans isomerase B (cyclophilin B)
MKRWIVAAVLLVAMIAAYNWLLSDEIKPTRVEVVKPPAPTPKKKATMEPGRVVELHTKKGNIDIVLFEKDCPKTTKRIADLIAEGAYNGVSFPRVERNVLIQTDQAKSKHPIKPMHRELLDGLINTKGAVGMARTDDVNSAKSVFYILIEPLPQLDFEYTIFGRLIRGMDVVTSIKKGDVIMSAKLRPPTEADKKALTHVLTIESERRVN